MNIHPILTTMAKPALSAVLFFSLPLSSAAREATVSSPDGKLMVSVADEGQGPTYTVTLDGHQMLLPSALGFKSNIGDFTQGLKITGSRSEQTDKRYEMTQVKQREFHYVANVLTVDFEGAGKQKMSVQFSVSDNDVAFRYLIPRQKDDNPKSAVIESEATAFRLPDGTTTFLSPQSGTMVGWERTKPSYEEEYKADAPMDVKSHYGQGYTFPCLFRLPSVATDAQRAGQEGWVLISETGVSSAYCGSHLSDYDPQRGYSIAYPMTGENNGNGTATAGISLPGQTPWRTITVGKTLKPIVETTVQYDVVEPLYEPSQQYGYGRYTWSWLIWQDNSINYDDQVRFIDLASAMGYELCLVDNWWDKNIGRERMAELARYAQTKGVGLMLWYNSNGYENDAPQTPRQCMNTPMARDREMAWMKSIGVKGIKVDFFGGDKQETMKLYEDILYDANRYGLQCIFHGCTLPRGWERMYPNFVASEAVLASENVYFSEHHARQEPFELTMHPFCRNAVATMDWGGVIMNRYLSKDNKSRHQRYTTDAFEIATAFTNQTAVQCVAMQPNNLGELPAAELDFLKRIPTTWDETRFVDGYPGRYVVLARRHGDQWFVAGLNATGAPLTLTLSLPMYTPGATISLVYDRQASETGAFATGSLKLDKRGLAKVTMQPNGGFVAYDRLPAARMGIGYDVPLQGAHEQMLQGKYEPSWESLKQHETPEWFRDAKFGMWAHWGPQCVEGSGDWMAREMYMEGTGKYKYHVEHYGHPSEFGFKDVLPLFKAENWEPEKLVERYKRCGAQYFFVLANHHDNYDLWDSKYQPWNSKNIGPKRDVLGEWAKAAKKCGLPLGLSFHADHAWTWYEPAQRYDLSGPKAGEYYDGTMTKADGKGKWWDGLDPQMLYRQDHPLSDRSWSNHGIHGQWDWGAGAALPSQEFVANFFDRTIDAINRYEPDLVYYDATVAPFYPISDCGLQITAHLYNKNPRAVVFGKILDEEQRQALTWDVERGAPNQIIDYPWQTCNCIGNWHYNTSTYENNKYKTAATVVKQLVDIVSKNGCLLLSVPLRADGTYDEKEAAILDDLEAWMSVNGESIFGTRPWDIFGEGPVAEKKIELSAQGFNDGQYSNMDSRDIRFNQTKKHLYVTAMGWPDNHRLVVKSLASGNSHIQKPITTATLLGYGKVKVAQTEEGLVIDLPAEPVNAIAPVVRINK